MLLRGVTKSKWANCPAADISHISADCISDLRTSRNALSVWSVGDDADIKNVCAIIALNRVSFQKVSYVLFDEKWFSENNMQVSDKQKGECKCIDADNNLLNAHRDVVGLDYGMLGVMANKILDMINDERAESAGILCEKELAISIQGLINKGVVDKAKVNEAFMKRVNEYVDKQSKSIARDT